MPLHDWKTGDGYEHTGDSGLRALAWEFARRNDELAAEMARDDVDPDDLDAFARWGLRFRR